MAAEPPGRVEWTVELLRTAYTAAYHWDREIVEADFADAPV
ncbi:hypothetical protein [uncultured Friedmanniella sp.]